MPTFTEIVKKSEDEIAADRVWRAKEIVSGNLFQRKYSKWESDPEILDLYFYYGKLLARLGDEMDAGRFMFLSGIRTSESAGPISLFTKRLGTPDAMNLYRSFPGRGKLNFVSSYPPSVAEDLQTLGMPENLYQAAGLTAKSAPSPTAEQLKQWKRQERWSLFWVVLLLIAPWVIGLSFMAWQLVRSLAGMLT